MRFKYKLSCVLLFSVMAGCFTCYKTSAGAVPLYKDSILQKRNLIINGIKYTVINSHCDSTSALVIKNNQGRVVFTHIEAIGIGNIKFIDFDGDDYKDIELELLVADSEQEDLVLYDPQTRKFVFAGNCPQGQHLKHTKYYYTYEDCCAGRNWDSELFYIANAKMVIIGKVVYSDGDGLAFYKFRNGKKMLFKKRMARINGDTPVLTGPHIDFDIDKYWPRNWSLYTN